MKHYSNHLRTGLAVVSILAGCLCLALTLPAQNTQPKGKGKAGADRTAGKEGGQTYHGRLIAVRPETGRIVFQVQQGESRRIFNMVLDDQPKVNADGAGAGLRALRPNTEVTITTQKREGIERVVAINTGRQADQDRDERPLFKGEATGGKISLAYPTGNRETSVLMIETNAPDEVRVGQTYDYRVKLTNITKNVALENVRVLQSLAESLEPQLGRSDAGKGGKKGDGEAGQDPDQSGQGDVNMLRWTIPSLSPNESVILRARVAAHEEGVVGSCFRISYQPALCVRIKATKPELQISKMAPDSARQCGEFTFQYTVKNIGSAVAKGVVITEELPNGLKTADGKQTIRHEVGNLEPGKTAKHSVKLQAESRGTYTSQAMVKSDGGLTVQSRKTTTRVREADLTVLIDGPQQQYVQQGATYTVTVRNEGDAPAPETRLTVYLDPKSRFVRASSMREARHPAGEENERPAKKARGERADARAEGPTPDDKGQVTWGLGTLAPGAQRKVTFSVRGRDKGTIKHSALAAFACDGAKDDVAVVQDTIQTEMMVVPALRLSLVDQNDLIPVGEHVTYTLRVTNQGTGPDQDVAISLNLPSEVQFVDAVGPTKPQADGNTLNLGTVDELAPGQTISWNIRVKAMKEGDVRTEAKLDSAYLDQPVSTTEPTRLVK